MRALNQVWATALALLTATAAPALAAERAATYREAGCNRCHAVAAAGIEVKRGSRDLGRDLSGYRSRFGKKKLVAYLRGESRLDAAEHAASFKGTDEELQAIIDWLGSLEVK